MRGGSRLVDIRGQTFGRLVALEHAGGRYWHCQCSCGTLIKTSGDRLRVGKTKSCGCLQRELTARRKTKHGATRRNHWWPEWNVWRQMINRCTNENVQNYERYGGRGIRVCDRWRIGENGMTGFECFIADVGRRPQPNLSIDRFPDNNGNYEPGNVRWATAVEQANNRRKRKDAK